jgi:hypothetical protein
MDSEQKLDDLWCVAAHGGPLPVELRLRVRRALS